MKWEERALTKLNWKLPTNKIKYICGNSISRIYKEVTYEPITRIISKQLDIKLDLFTQVELDSVLRNIKNRKAAGIDEIPPEVWKSRKFDDILLRHCNAVCNENPIDRLMKGCIPTSLKEQPRISQELPRYNPYVHSGQDIQCPTTQPHRTQNWLRT